MFVRAKGQMLKIQRKADGDVVLTLSGRLESENVTDLSALLAAETSGHALVLDLEDVVLVDRDVVRFLRNCESRGISLRNCPPFIRAWITGEGEPT